MKFEEALPLLREGKKLTNLNFDEKGDYWIAGYIEIMSFDKEEPNPKTFTLYRCNESGTPYIDSRAWGIPRWLVMDDSWEVL